MQTNILTVEELKKSLPITLDKMYPDYFDYLRKERKRFVFYPGLDQVMFSSCMDEYLNRRGERASFIIEKKDLPISLSVILGQMTGLSSEYGNDFKEHFMEITSFKDFFKRYGDVVCKSIKRYIDYKDDPRLT